MKHWKMSAQEELLLFVHQKMAKKPGNKSLTVIQLFEVIELLAQDKPLPKKNYAHKLKGQYIGVWECHIKPDWLLMWQEDRDKLILLLLNTATHSDFIGKRKK